MKKGLIIIVLSILMMQCEKKNNFLVAKNKVGKITSTTQVYELKSLFTSDSLVVRLGEGDFADSSYDEYLVYSKKGKHLLTITPKEQHDSTATIEHIQILDTRFLSDKKLGLSSTFKDIIENYTVGKVEPVITSVFLTIDELNATITIDKKELGIDNFGNQKIVVEQIPDMAKIKTFTVWFD